MALPATPANKTSSRNTATALERGETSMAGETREGLIGEGVDMHIARPTDHMTSCADKALVQLKRMGWHEYDLECSQCDEVK